MLLNNQASAWRGLPRVALAAALVIAIAACGKDDAPAQPDAAATGTAAAGANATEAAAEQAAAQADALAALGPDELRERGRTAYAESRLYAPAGDNALEYYLALREKSPGDAAVASALTDLMPMLVIATEQARDREDFEESRRLAALVARADATHPALQRLQASIDTADAAVKQRIEQQALSTEQEAERQRQLATEREKAQADQQRVAAEQLAEQQRTAERDAAARVEAERVAAEQRAAEQRAAEQRQAQQPATPPPAPAAAAAPTLRPLSTPAPRYPADALRAAQSGEVQVEFTVAPDGSVSDARVVRADPPRVFDREAVAAVRRWRFEPVAQAVTTRRTIAFNPGG
ncbi:MULTISPECIES: energy transducer TonB [unclassified Luteimonas]|uniref:energy transducer TonB n=1 Tax=unclassified Luteimonas TaxID=2629088 RepID=UPI0018F0E81E|nr:MULTISPECIES: energy transducer TonB [unclassified Luteimonas]MBJ6979218.1 TonB family protein [Luteimonas sp. MC1895]MBJ6985235.1 TonB family protein [Luteimonas sp. MC1750]QQO05881.1 TonB family protein [Luteimonas sp. MC1750]